MILNFRKMTGITQKYLRVEHPGKPPTGNYLRVEHPDKPFLALLPDYYRWEPDGELRCHRNGRVLIEDGTGTEVWVRVRVCDHHKPVAARKAHLLLAGLHGWPGYWVCRDCDERVYDVPGHLDGHLYNTCPQNLKWVEDLAGCILHSAECFERMLDRYETEPGYANDTPRVRDSNQFMTAVACFLGDNDYEEDDIRTGLPRMFHSVSRTQDKVLNDPEKLSPTSNQPTYF
jgi:hypothetical protein